MGDVMVQELSPLHDEQGEVIVEVVPVNDHLGGDGTGRWKGVPRLGLAAGRLHSWTEKKLESLI